jgi:hypothetical protein
MFSIAWLVAREDPCHEMRFGAIADEQRHGRLPWMSGKWVFIG